LSTASVHWDQSCWSLVVVERWSLLEYSFSSLGPEVVGRWSELKVVASRRIEGRYMGGKYFGRSKEGGHFSEGSLIEYTMHSN
jgi:hypothetical protein